MSRQPIVIACLLLVAIPVAALAPQDDAGSGGDAPGRPDSLLLAPGSYAGLLEPPTDAEDAYRVEAEAGLLTVVRTQFGAVRSPEVFEGNAKRWADFSSEPPSWVLVTPDPLAFALQSWFNRTHSYDMDVFRVAPITLRVTDVQFKDLTDGRRAVRFTVENPTETDDPATWAMVTVRQGTSERVSGAGARPVPAGGSVSFDVMWDNRGQVGDVEVTACAFPMYGTEPTCQATRSHALLRGEGRDLLNEDVGIPLPDGTTVWVDPSYARGSLDVDVTRS